MSIANTSSLEAHLHYVHLNSTNCCSEVSSNETNKKAPYSLAWKTMHSTPKSWQGFTQLTRCAMKTHEQWHSQTPTKEKTVISQI